MRDKLRLKLYNESSAFCYYLAFNSALLLKIENSLGEGKTPLSHWSSCAVKSRLNWAYRVGMVT
jgi:hypothetical protein